LPAAPLFPIPGSTGTTTHGVAPAGAANPGARLTRFPLFSVPGLLGAATSGTAIAGTITSGLGPGLADLARYGIAPTGSGLGAIATRAVGLPDTARTEAGHTAALAAIRLAAVQIAEPVRGAVGQVVTANPGAR
jgi:hypothetical protein